MILHYLKTALRNIRGNWVYTILSICCLAIGTAMFSAFFYGVNYDCYKYNRRPLYKRSAIAYEDIPGDDRFSNNRSFIQRGGHLPVNFKTLSKLDIPEIEYVSGYGSSIPADFRISDSTRVYLDGAVRGLEVCRDYYKVNNLTLLYGDRTPQNANEIVVSESFLKRIGYDKEISRCSITDTRSDKEYFIVNVIRDDVWSRYQSEEIYFLLNEYSLSVLINPTNINCDVVLKKGVDIDDVNRILSTSYTSEYVNSVVQLSHSYPKPDDPMLGLLSIIVLLVAAANFFKHTVMLLKQRGRANIVRYSLGAGKKSLSQMLLTEIALVLVCSLAIALYLSFHVCNWLNNAAEFLDNIYFNYPDIALLDMLGIAVVGLAGAVVCRISAGRQNRLLKQRIVAQRCENKTIRHIVIGLETTVAICALTVALYTTKNAPKAYNPLPEQVSRRVFYVENNEQFNVEEFYNKLRQMPQVDEIITTDGSWRDYPGFSQVRIGGELQYLIVLGHDIRYFSFFNIPIEWLDPIPPSNGYLLDRYTYEELQRNGVDLESLEFANGYNSGNKIHVSGVFDHRICDDLSGYTDRVNRKQNDGNSVWTFYRAFHFSENPEGYPNEFFIKFGRSVSPAKAQSLIREKWNELYPMSTDGLEISPLPEYVDDDFKYRVLAFNLGSIICILLVILSVSSSISAETNMRRKEVALRKINGAKAADILGLFIKPYGVILLVSFVIGSLASVALIKSSDIDYGIDILMIALVALVMTALVIMLSVFRRIRSIMRTNPADVIKSE